MIGLAPIVLAGALGAAAASPPAPPVTFTRDVAPIVFARCASCHHAGGAAPFSLITYDEARRHAAQIAAVTRRRFMPPWKPAPGYGEFVGSRRLSDAEIDVFARWAADGAVEGDPAALPPAPRWSGGWQLGHPDLILTLPEYTLRADGVDVFRNFVLPIPIDGTRFVRGLEFRPGSAAVHHANIRVDPTPASRRLDEADPEPGYEGLILNSAEYPDGHFLGWTPGQVVPLAPKGLAWRVTGGTDFVVQLHMRPTGKPERVQPSIGLYFTDEAPTETPVMLRLGRQNLDIAPNERDYRSVDTYVLPVDVQVQEIQPHSHYRARSIKAWAELPAGGTRPLIYIPQWDFAWQDAYRYASPFWLPAGTRIVTEYRFDNTADNPRNPASPPRRALWGFRSSDEMADVWIQVLTRTDADRRRLAASFRRKADEEDIVGYETRIREDPAYAALHADVAVLYLEIGKPQGAVDHFGAVVRLQPASAVAVYNLGTALEAAGRFDEASAEYAKAIALDPAYAAAHVNLGNLQLRAGRLADARGEYEAAVRLDPASADAHNNLGRVLLLGGDRARASAEIAEALRLRPAYAEARFNAGELRREAGQWPAAVEEYAKAIEIRPDWAPCLARLAWVLSTAPDPAVRDGARAVPLASRAVDLTGRSDLDALDALAAAYARAGRFRDAESTAVAALKLAKTPEQAAEIRTRGALYRRHEAYTDQVR